MKYTNNNNVEEINYILKIYFDTPLYYAVDTETFTDPETLEEINISQGLMKLPTSTSKEIDTKECTLSNDSITIELSNKDLSQTVMMYNAINSDTENIYKREASLFISLDGVITKEFSGFITAFPTVDVWETKISLKIDNTREILSSSLFEDQLSDNNANKTKLEDSGFESDIRTKDRGVVYSRETTSDMLLIPDIIEDDSCYVTSESKFYVNDTGYNTELDDWGLKKEVDIKKVIVWGNHLTKYRLTDFALALFLQVFDNDEAMLNKYIDVDSFDYNNYDDSKKYKVYYEFYEKIDNVFDFVQEEIFKYLNAYPVVDNDGKLKLIKQQQPEVGETVNIVDRDNIINVVGNENNFSNLITNVNVNYDYNFRKEEFKSDPQNYQSDTINKYGKNPKKPYEYDVKFDKNMTVVEKSTFNQGMANYLFERYADRQKVLTFDLFFSNKVVNEGDHIKLDHELLIDWEEGSNTGLRGINLVVESPDMIINNGDQWGDFIGNSKNNAIGYLGEYKVIKVDRDVNTTFFNEDKSIAFNHWNSKYNIPARFQAVKGTGSNEGNYGEVK